MRKIKKIAIILLIISSLIVVLQSQRIFAYDMMGEINTQAGYQATGDGAELANSVTNIAGTVITVTRVICAGIAVIMIVVLAMKYMMAAPGDRADIKKHAVVYIVGAVIMFATTGILTIIQNFSKIIH